MAPTADQLVMDGTLTPRQGEIATLLAEGLKAREIGEQLGITRNAVYSQINAIKKKGVLGDNYTPSGEVRTPARHHTPASAAEILDHITQPAPENTGGTAYMDVIRELMTQNRILLEVVKSLTKSA